MNKYLYLFLLLFITVDAFADYTYTSNAFVDTFPDNNIFVDNGVEITAYGSENIKTQNPGPTTLYNKGVINGTIDTNNYNLFIHNTGTITGGVTTVNGGNVVQVINSNAEMTHFDVIGGNYEVNIDGAQNISFSDITSMNATKFELQNATIIVNNLSDLQNWNQNVYVNDNVRLIVNNIDSENTKITIDNIVSGLDNLDVQFKNIDNMYSVKKENNGSSLIITTERVTDANLIYKNKDEKAKGDVLEKLRDRNPNDKLIRALDKARNSTEVKDIQNNSYRFNHGILLRPVKMINNFNLLNPVVEDDGVGLNTFYVFSDTVRDFGGDIYVGFHYDDLYLNFGLNMNQFTYEDDLNDFSGTSYGFNIKAKQKISDFWIDGIAGFSLTKYKANYVTLEETLKTDPIGLSGYGKVSFGYDYKITPDFVISPFVGTSYQRYDVADVDDTDLYLFSGGNIKYSFDIDGIKYEYAFKGSVTNNGDISSTIDVGFLSVTDGAGASLSAGLFKNEYDCYYKLSLNAKISF